MKEEMDEIIEDANSKLVREVEIEGDHPAKILAKCGDGTHLYYSFNHLPYELRRVIQNLPGTLGYTKVELESHMEDLIDMVKRLPDEPPNQLEPLYRKFKEEELNTKKMVRDWRNFKNELNVFEGTQPVGDLPYREEDRDGTKVLILEDSGYVVEK